MAFAFSVSLLCLPLGPALFRDESLRGSSTRLVRSVTGSIASLKISALELVAGAEKCVVDQLGRNRLGESYFEALARPRGELEAGKYLGRNGVDDETRTRDLCRDSAA